jgi:hypothetical protein
MASVSRQRERYEVAVQLSKEASLSLQPLHDDLATVSPSFDGIVYFAVDRWHRNNASAVATVQPQSSDAERFAFYKEKIAHHRVDLGATALGQGLRLAEPELLRSRMNPDHHVTWTHRSVVDDKLAGGLQVAFNTTYGPAPSDTRTLTEVWNKHKGTVDEVAHTFAQFSKEVPSVGDVLDLYAPATPNAYVASWDLRNSTALALGRYGALRNYLLDTKNLFSHLTQDVATYTHDTGDGQDISFWLPETSEVFDRADRTSIRKFGQQAVLPLVERLLEAHDNLAREDYQDSTPQINFVIGLGYVEHDRYDGRTSQEYWKVADEHKQHPANTISFTDTARAALEA